MRYEFLRYIFPPRPMLFTPKQLDNFENKGWVGQLKLNGTRTLVTVSPEGDIQFFTRHNTKHKAYKLTERMRDSFLKLKGKHKGWLVFDSELLHSKHASIKDTLVLFDIFVLDSEYLFGVSYADRYATLKKLCSGVSELVEGPIGHKVTDALWLIKNYYENFRDLFNRVIKREIIEGLVVKNTSAKLGDHFVTDKCDWAGKIRKPKPGVYRV